MSKKKKHTEAFDCPQCGQDMRLPPEAYECISRIKDSAEWIALEEALADMEAANAACND